jgi:hypothetical protein
MSPEPWKLRIEKINSTFYAEVTSDGTVVAAVVGLRTEEGRANVRLIQRAPEMYWLLKGALAVLEAGPPRYPAESLLKCLIRVLVNSVEVDQPLLPEIQHTERRCAH